MTTALCVATWTAVGSALTSWGGTRSTRQRTPILSSDTCSWSVYCHMNSVAYSAEVHVHLSVTEPTKSWYPLADSSVNKMNPFLGMGDWIRILSFRHEIGTRFGTRPSYCTVNTSLSFPLKKSVREWIWLLASISILCSKFLELNLESLYMVMEWNLSPGLILALLFTDIGNVPSWTPVTI
jgi:hypothetical protein